MRRRVSAAGRLLPHGWGDFWVQFAVFWTFYVGYEISGHVASGARSTALANGERVIAAERSLHLLIEPDVQRWTLHDAPAGFLWLANNTYFTCQFAISFGFMLWTYAMANHVFYFVRNTILMIDFIGLVGYFTVPTAPPRMFPGFVDTLHTQPISMQSSLVKALGNPYAAMPSLHSAYAIVLGVTGVAVFTSPLARAFWAIYPMIVVYAIIATGNHFVLDAIAGFCVAGIALVASLAIASGRFPRRGAAPVGFLVPRPAPTPA
jgi:hypothetical protein